MYEHQWDRLRAADPEHSARYAQRWRDLAAAGHDLDGEARFVSALAPPGASVLDAGCGTGRVGGYLARQGYRVVGVDLDEHLIAQARRDHPAGDWHVGDLASFDYAALTSVTVDPGDDEGFDVIVSAGNVLTFLDPTSRRPVLERLKGALGGTGRLVTGFGRGRGYSFDDFAHDLEAVGLRTQSRFATWNVHPFDDSSDFLVCISSAEKDHAPVSRAE